MNSVSLELKELSRKIRSIPQKDDLPCFSETLRRLVDLEPDDELSAQELAEIILEDFGLISKILQTVNSFYYNRLGQEISTVTQAVILLGFNTIRKIALGLSVLECLPRGENDSAGKLIARAYIAAYLAQGLSETLIEIEPEEIFIATLFSPLIRIIVAVCDEDLYKAVVKHEERGEESEKIYIRNMWRDMGNSLAENGKLPKIIYQHLEGHSRHLGYIDEKVYKIIKHSQAVAQQVITSGKKKDFLDNLGILGRICTLSKKEVFNKAEKAIAETKLCSPIFKEFVKDIQIVDLFEEEDIKTEQVPEKKSLSEGQHPTEDVKDREDVFLNILTQTSSMILEKDLSLDQLYLFGIEALHRGVGLERVLLCLLTLDRKTLLVRCGVGNRLKEIKSHFRVDFPVESQPLGRALKDNKEMVGKWSQIPTVNGVWKNDLREKNVCVSPLVIRGRSIGCFIVEKEFFSAKDIKKISSIRQLIVLATKQMGGKKN